ncbi:hypothetical protein Tco_0951479 [Tanacetum coccineum]|uniref:Zinc finger, CCHC-type n=1 Tax=Tanacetum coccineum TaxID=301880 RepID=A0ABQ5E0A2_9ASTR
MASMNTRLNIEKLDGNIVQKHGGSKQVGFKQLGPGVETGVHGVHDEKRVWFEVELQGAQGDREAEVFQVSNDDTAVAQRWLEDKQPEEKTNTDCLVKEQEKEYQTGWKIKTGNVLDSCNQSLVCPRNMGFNESRKYKKTFIGSGVGTGSVQVLQGVEFEVEPQEDHTFEVEPHGNVDHVAGSQEVQTQDLIYYHLARNREQHSTHELFSHREDSNEAAFAVAEAKNIYAHESLTFNNTVACEVISKWNAGLKDDIDARSDVYVLSNGYDMVFIADARLISGLPRVCWIKQREMYLTLLEGQSILSLEGSLLGDRDVEKNGCNGGLFGLTGLAIKVWFELKIVAGIETCAWSKKAIIWYEGPAYDEFAKLILGASSSAVIRGSGLRDDQAARVYATAVSHSWNEGLHETSFYNDVAPNVGGLDDHVMMDEQSAEGQYVGSSGGNDQPVFISVDVSVGTTHNAAEGTAAPLWLEARYKSLLVAYQDLQTKVATLHRERNDAELKSNEFQGMVLHRDGNIKLFMMEFERVSKERGELQKQVLSLEREVIRARRGTR